MNLRISARLLPPARQALLSAALLLCLAGEHALADDRDPVQPRPFLAEYEARANGLTATAVRQLTVNEEGVFTLENSLNLTLVGASVSRIEETTHFLWQQGKVLPVDYRYEQTRLGARLESIHFDQEKRLATSEFEDQTLTLPLPETQGTPVQDKLSLSVQMAQDLVRMDPETLSGSELIYSVLDRDEIEEQRYRVEGEETMDTPLGPMDVLRVVRVRSPESRRQTVFWLAREQPCLLVSLLQISGDGTRTELTLSSLKREAPEEPTHSTN